MLLLVKYIDYYNLYISSKFILPTDSFFDTNLIYKLLGECFLAIIHPNIILIGKTWRTSKVWNLHEIVYYSNDILVILQLLRVYSVVTQILSFSSFFSAKADRISLNVYGM